jgi:serine protease Do
MAARMVVRHLAGSKVNQVEQFPIDAATEVTIGREPGVPIQFDPLRDDAVSRRHVKITIEPGDPPRFRITDLGSRNGTFLNGERIVAETEVLPGDTVELGAGGPKFEFDVQPRPTNLFGRTRAIPAAAIATRVIDNTESEPPPTVAMPTVGMMSVQPPPRPGIGRNTLLHELSIQRQATRQIMIYGLIGVLVVVGAVGGALYYTHQKSVAEQNARIAEEKTQLEAQNSRAVEQQVTLEEENAKFLQQEKKIGMTPQEIADKFGNATVMIDVHWRLYDIDTGKPLFHKTFADGKGNLLPAYVEYRNKIYRWLTAQEDLKTNFPIEGVGQGSGFVIRDQGLILTNKHVAAGWMISYGAYSKGDTGKGILFQAQSTHYSNDKEFLKKNKPEIFDLRQNAELLQKFQQAVKWHPDEGGLIFANTQPVIIGEGEHRFEGRNDELSVRFPGGRFDIHARLVRASTDNDVALIQIDSFQKLVPDALAEDDKVDIGEPVVVLGYPGASIENRAIVTTVEGSEVHQHDEVIPEPTLTPGVVSMKGTNLKSEGSVMLVSALGDAYQMTVPATAGNSGGPVFNRKGEVIALFTWGSGSHENMTFAVPIKYARALLQLQRVN